MAPTALSFLTRFSRLNNTLPALCFVNGQPASQVAVDNRGLQYGDGLFETMLWLDSHVVLEKQHLLRLFRDAKRLGIRLDESSCERELARFCYQIRWHGFPRGVIKLLVTRESLGRGYAADAAAGSERILQFYPGITYPKQHRSGVRVSLASYQLGYQPQLAGIKHINRLDQVMLQKELHKPFYQEILASGQGGEVIEGSISNLFVIKDRHVHTPRLDRAGVRGVMRDYLLDMVLPDLKLEHAENQLPLDEVLAADELFICNSVFGIWPVIAINVRQYPVGAVTRALQASVDNLGYPSIHR